MLSDENIKKLLNIDTDDEKFYICHICLEKEKKFIEKEKLTTDEIKEIIIINSIFEKNIEKILNKEVILFLKKERERYLNKKELKKQKEMFNIEKEEIQTYLKNIYEDIKRIREQKELKIQEQKDKIQKQEKEQKLKEEKKENHKKLNDYLLDDISLN